MKNMKKEVKLSCAVLAIFTLFLIGFTTTVATVSRDPVQSKHGMVVSVSPIASEVGVEILKKGGNAIDAAVAVGFALCVTWPEAGNLGADGFMIVHHAETDETVAIDYRAMAPLRSHRDMYLDSSGEIIPKIANVGHLSAAVPGAVAGLFEALERYGTMSPEEVLAPSIDLAEKGFPIDAFLARSLSRAEPLLSQFPESKRIFLRDGDFYEKGDVFVQPDLADTLRMLASRGASGFYEGKVPSLVAEEMARGGGIIDEEDFKEYKVVVREPVRGDYRGHGIAAMPPPSSGGTILVEMLNMVEHENLTASGHNTAETIHSVAEVMRRAYADRAEFMADADFSPVPMRGLTSKKYAEYRRKDVDSEKATSSSEVGAGDPFPFESENTTHFSVIDRHGNAVSNTYTLKSLFGSGVTIPGAGFLMNNEMDNFTIKVGVPNIFGLIQSEDNIIEPRKRPLSSMSPTIVFKDGKVRLVTGSPGGSTIINTVFQVVMNVVDHGLGAQDAVDATRFHHQWLPDELVYEEGGLDAKVTKALELKGHAIQTRPSIGDAHSILVDMQTGVRFGAADQRRGGKAVGH